MIVFQQIISPANWEHFDPWLESDPTIESTFSGPASGVGAKRSWTSLKSGTGSLTVVEVKEYELIRNKLLFIEPWQSEADDIWTFESTENGTKVTWVNEGSLGRNPLQRYYGLLFDKMFGKMFEKGLANLKAFCEGSRKQKGVDNSENVDIIDVIKVDEKLIKGQPSISIRMQGAASNASAIHETIYQQLFVYIKEVETEVDGDVFSIFHSWNDSIADIEAGIPINKEVPGNGKIKYGLSPSGKFVSLIHLGNYDDFHRTHDTFRRWMEKNKVTPSGPAVHIYRNLSFL